MTRVVVTDTARADLDDLIRTHRLPASTRVRVRASLVQLNTFPLIGRGLLGRWAAFRVVLGPWPWMLVVYSYDEGIDEVAIITIQDSRTARAATTEVPSPVPGTGLEQR